MLTGIKILLVEDEKEVANTMLKLLTTMEASVVNAVSIQDGLKKLDQEKFDVIVLDLFLPNGKGLMVISSFQEKSPEIPIVVFTGMMYPSLSNEALQSGAQEIVIKGAFSSKELETAIDHAIERHKVRKKFEPLSKILDKADQTLKEMQTFLNNNKQEVIK